MQNFEPTYFGKSTYNTFGQIFIAKNELSIRSHFLALTSFINGSFTGSYCLILALSNNIFTEKASVGFKIGFLELTSSILTKRPPPWPKCSINVWPNWHYYMIYTCFISIIIGKTLLHSNVKCFYHK